MHLENLSTNCLSSNLQPAQLAVLTLLCRVVLCYAVLPSAPTEEVEEPTSPTAAAAAAAAGLSSSVSPLMSRSAGGSSSSRRLSSARTPVPMVRESMPLFVSDPSRAVGSALAVEESLEDQDLQQLVGGPQLAVAGAAAAAAAAAASSRLLSHGGPQRVAVGQLGANSLMLNPLTPVAEGFTTSPIPEE